MSNNKGKPEGEQKELTFEDLVAELPLDDEKKQMVSNLVTGLVAGLNQINTRLDDIEKQPAAESPDIYEGLTGDQKFQVMMAKFSAPAAAAQQSLFQSLLARAAGGGSGGDLANLVNSAEMIGKLRSVISPEPTALQVAMEKASVAQVLAQTRLMNKVAGKETDKYLDNLEAELVGSPETEVEE